MFRNPTTDLLVVLLIVLLIWGPKRLPGLGRQLGQGIREFKDSVTGGSDADEADHPQITESTAGPTAPTPPPTAATAEQPAEVTPSERRS